MCNVPGSEIYLCTVNDLAAFNQKSCTVRPHVADRGSLSMRGKLSDPNLLPLFSLSQISCSATSTMLK